MSAAVLLAGRGILRGSACGLDQRPSSPAVTASRIASAPMSGFAERLSHALERMASYVGWLAKVRPARASSNWALNLARLSRSSSARLRWASASSYCQCLDALALLGDLVPGGVALVHGLGDCLALVVGELVLGENLLDAPHAILPGIVQALPAPVADAP